LCATVFLPTTEIERGRILWPDRAYLALTLQGAGNAKIAWTLDQLKAMRRVKKDARMVALTARTQLDKAPQAPAFTLMSWEEARAAQERGVLAFGPHSTTHEILSRCEDAEVARQVQGSVDALRQRLGVESTVFAYPNGRAQDFDERTRAALTAAGVPFALTTIEGRNGRGADLLALRRACVGADADLPTFILAASGWTDRS
jgi:peptidoglycan/xylan/chitin deacetylase (PgdA/CDA1 family)